MSAKLIFDSIFDDDLSTTKTLLRGNPKLAVLKIVTAKLYRGKIDHWIYVGDTPLHLAAAGHRVEIVKMLLAAGADPNSMENHRRSGPLHYAADGHLAGITYNAARQVETIQCLLEAGASISAADKNGATPLHRAVRTRCAAAVRFLLEAGGDPVQRNKPGSTPFHLAVQNTGRGGSGAEIAKVAQRQIIEAFLSFGVSARLKDGKGKSVLDCAKSDWIRNLLQASS